MFLKVFHPLLVFHDDSVLKYDFYIRFYDFFDLGVNLVLQVVN